MVRGAQTKQSSRVLRELSAKSGWIEAARLLPETFACAGRSLLGACVNPESKAEHDLLQDVAKGDRLAFGTLFDRHAAAAMRYAMRLVRDRAASEDAVHAAFARLLEAARSHAIDPDRGSGALEWLVVAASAASSVALAWRGVLNGREALRIRVAER